MELKSTKTAKDVGRVGFGDRLRSSVLDMVSFSPLLALWLGEVPQKQVD